MMTEVAREAVSSLEDDDFDVVGLDAVDESG
jgi:hypothetical protein